MVPTDRAGSRGPGRGGALATAEDLSYALVSLLFLALYLYHGFLLPRVLGGRTRWFGFDRAASLGWAGVLGPLAALALVGVLGSRRSRVAAGMSRAQDWLSARPVRLVLLGAAAAAGFFLLRNNFLNPDGENFIGAFAEDVPVKGAHVTHDEMWELYLHSRFWFHANRWFGWSVPLSYQVLSSLAGGVFVTLLVAFSRLVSPARSLPFFLCVVSGGYMQLFFGDVENYTLTAAILMAYFLAALLYLQGRAPLVAATGALAVAMTFHLLAGFLLPSLAYLGLRELKGRRWRSVSLNVAVFAGVLGGTLLFFHLNGLPIGDLYWKSHAFGHGGDILEMLVRPSWRYYRSILNLVFLLVPIWLFLVPLALFGRVRRDAVGLHLILAASGMTLFVLAWEAKLGVYQDWNLFANAAIPIALLASRGLVEAADTPRRWWSVAAGVALSAFHSYAWIVGNHVLFRIQ